MTHATPHNEPATSITSWLKQEAGQDCLRLIVCGGTDNDTSTLISRLLHRTELTRDKPLKKPRVANTQRLTGRHSALASALPADDLNARREHDAAMDVTYHHITTPLRHLVIADIPEHAQNTSNIITTASTADTAILLVDARHGLDGQTRRHARLIALMGIHQIIVGVNKMDLINFSAARFQAIEAELHALADTLDYTSISVIPLSTLSDGNIITRSAHTPWYQGETLMHYLETTTILPQDDRQFTFPVQWVNHHDTDFYGYSGTVASGHITPGDTIRVTASGQTATLRRIVTFDGDLPRAQVNDAITLVFDTEIDISRGDILTTADAPLDMSDQFEATLVWLHQEPGLIGRSYEIKLASQQAGAALTTIKHCINTDTGSEEPARQLQLDDISVCNLALDQPLAFDRYRNNKTLGGFILIDRFNQDTVAIGMINHNLRRAQNVHRQALNIGRRDREKLNGHSGKVIWLTGLSGSGKSTIANALEKTLYAQGRRTYILDGDNIRQGLNKDLGFVDADRVENIRRVAEVAKLMLDAGLIVITAFISPFRAERDMARQLIGHENFIEVFVDTPLALCEERDPKGLYKKARSGQLPNMTGIGSPYEAPENADLVIAGGKEEMTKIIEKLLLLLQ